jgi:hypothetical protein
LVAQSAAFAERLRREVGDDASKKVDRAFRLAFGRAPSALEREAATELVRREGAGALCRALYNANEFVFVR